KLLVTFAVKVTKQNVLFMSMPLDNFYTDYVNTQTLDQHSNSFVLSSNCLLVAHQNLQQQQSNQAHLADLCQAKNQLINFEEQQQDY
ncbi:hypothetical protein AB4511_26255, partial [Vibrio sp. 10N.222.54.F6]